jgi:transcriptional regulator with XRE-family HTH domain
MRVPEIVGYRMREVREKDLGWTQAQLAEHLEAYIGRKWFPQTVSSAEKGARDFTAEELFCIAWALQRPIEFFFEAPADVKTIELPDKTLDASKTRKLVEDVRAVRGAQRVVQRLAKELGLEETPTADPERGEE